MKVTSKPWFRLALVILIFAALGLLLRWGGKGIETMSGPSAPKNAVLQLELEGVIMNGKRFLESLKTYSQDKNVKALVVNINSPGGAVGPSQDINAALRKVREELKLPIVCYSSGLMASGAYYSAVACDKIIVSTGALVGSIGVIMEFANLEKLYEWAHIQRYSIISGKFKDSGAEYRPMRDDERKLFQDLIDETYQQFKGAVAEGRPNLKSEVLTEYADGRVFTGASAVKLGFADANGTMDDAVKAAADLAKIGDNYELFKVPKNKRRWLNWAEDGDDSLNSVAHFTRSLLGLSNLNRPLYLMPGSGE